MQVIKLGSSGDEVRRWQYFLVGQKLLKDVADGSFGPNTRKATKAFQRLHELKDDGVVGPKTLARALDAGFDPGFVDPSGDVTGPSYPPRPAFPPLVSNQERAALFGKFEYTPAPCVKGGPSGGRVRIHKEIADQFARLLGRWQSDGVARLVLTWDGSFVARFVRGSRTVLSNHSFGTAFDINAAFNSLGSMPLLVGEKGSVRDLVTTANEHGFFWGGHFEGRPDGMHFEAAKIL